MKRWIICLICIVLLLLGFYAYFKCRNIKIQEDYNNTLLIEENRKLEQIRIEQEKVYSRAKLYADSAKEYLGEKKLRDDYCFLVDFSIHSGKNRFFVWSFVQDTIVDTSLCCHGYGNSKNRSTGSKIVFSNTVGSLCSSLGRYQTAYRDVCSYGTLFQYRLYGLDKTNDKAFQRAVTLHSFDGVPDKEMYPLHIPLGYSQGCLVVSNEMLNRLDQLLKEDDRKLLIWAYN